jgi:sugar phosphate permease
MKRTRQLPVPDMPHTMLEGKWATALILLCFVMYSTAYVGRYSYAANLINITDTLAVGKDEAGLVSSFFFFSYAAGQLLNASLARFYDPRRVVTIAMSVSGLCNLGMGICSDLSVMRLLWLVNGIVQSTLWCCLLNLQSRYLSGQNVSRAIVWNSMTVAAGTGLCYGLSALLTRLGVSWRVLFVICAALLMLVAVVWWLGVGRLDRHARESREVVLSSAQERLLTDEQVEHASATLSPSQKLFTRAFLPPFVLACVVAAACAFIRDGVVTWLPNILYEYFGVNESLSIALTMLLPMISVLGAVLVRWMQKRLRGNLGMEGILFAVAAVAILVIVWAFPYRLTYLTLSLFALSYLMLMAISNVTTSIIPFACRRRGNVGGVSALLDACCYLGTMISTYGFGLVAEDLGWMSVLTLIAIIAVVAVMLCMVGARLAGRDAITRDIL